jgi:hypothetical protein
MSWTEGCGITCEEYFFRRGNFDEAAKFAYPMMAASVKSHAVR